MAGKVAPEVEAYLERIERPEHRRVLTALRALIRKAAPEAEEVISYGQPTFKQDGHLVAYAEFKKHLSFFPMSSTIIEEHAEALMDFKTSKGTVQFAPDKPIPDEIVLAMVRARLKENAEIAHEKRLKKR